MFSYFIVVRCGKLEMVVSHPSEMPGGKRAGVRARRQRFNNKNLNIEEKPTSELIALPPDAL